MSEMLKELLSKHKHFYIAGAQSRARTLAGQLSFLHPELSIEAYLVDDIARNDTMIRGVPVYQIDTRRDFSKDSMKVFHTEYPVFIATKGIYHAETRKTLENLGFQEIIPVTVNVDNYFRNAYVKRAFSLQNKSFAKISDLSLSTHCILDEKPSVCIYVARSTYDKPLQSAYTFPFYERPIQAGAALTTERLQREILTDCTEDSISRKNRQYCELTALYWIWKHAGEDILGLVHYRRHFILPEQWLERMTENDIDVILPVPTYVQPSIEENYRERHDPSDWTYLTEYLREYYPLDYEAGKEVFAGNLYSPCNMFIMRREVLDELCNWMFPILDAVAAHGGVKEDTYQNRYVGFISERLITLFFYKNSEKYKIAYADKNFLN